MQTDQADIFDILAIAKDHKMVLFFSFSISIICGIIFVQTMRPAAIPKYYLHQVLDFRTSPLSPMFSKPYGSTMNSALLGCEVRQSNEIGTWIDSRAYAGELARSLPIGEEMTISHRNAPFLARLIVWYSDQEMGKKIIHRLIDIIRHSDIYRRMVQEKRAIIKSQIENIERTSALLRERKERLLAEISQKEKQRDPVNTDISKIRNDIDEIQSDILKQEAARTWLDQNTEEILKIFKRSGELYTYRVQDNRISDTKIVLIFGFGGMFFALTALILRNVGKRRI